MRKLTAKKLLKLGAQENCDDLARFKEVSPSGAAPTWANIEKALAAGLNLPWLAQRGGVSRELTLRLLPTLSPDWRGRVVGWCPRLTREDVLAALPTLDAGWRGRVVRYCERLTRKDVLAALPTLDAYWRGRVVCYCSRLTREDVLAALPTLDAGWRGQVVCECPRLTEADRANPKLMGGKP